ncbi:MAG: hypothetical protein JSU78_05610, partial [Deltaproteobacteria bacterium]
FLLLYILDLHLIPVSLWGLSWENYIFRSTFGKLKGPFYRKKGIVSLLEIVLKCSPLIELWINPFQGDYGGKNIKVHLFKG